MMRLEAEVKRLEAEYNMFFSGRLPKPPWETRGRVEPLVKPYERAHIQAYRDKFRFSTRRARFATLIDLWDRGMRAREEGRAGPFGGKRAEKPTDPERSKDRVFRVATFRDPLHEMERLEGLYESLVEARRELGQETVQFHKFAVLVNKK